MPTTKTKFSVRRPVVVDVGCGCRRPKLQSFFSPSPSYTSSSHFESTPTPSETTSSSSASTEKKKKKKEKKGRVSESVAVVKESQDPYLDFRDSMVLMIIEKEIYAWEDLKELLHRLLSLNAPHHHPLIFKAFADLCREIFSPR
ncbi:hypothetical protein J5N97_012161 [Dioscorea zingiberensis]|uniref:Transcription repressor n=1 Tax=Dioscorea zingiberensis TaxID=325984 RepID=A0A9D5CPC1_9LILI|nr:hypothetical protein J5N97_012161 [Dioscorea zingiberensis]